MAAGGYVGAWMGWGGDFLKNVGISALPGAAEKLYDKVKGMSARPSRSSRQLAFHRSPVSRYPASATETPFQGTRLV
jgi:hypothetical protein